ncbi:hypothetical protein EVAR_39743_1 [Eumeta japonica]|uniref:Reverse transcriptase domain-containing protein n=1 Tax=Eumeta variegata TaxID=151549 RepID=A0A4C1X6X7_EUMVA|nr:hypothetical protein EVAR_39743_1 [Eumeta japonica]
MDELSVKCLVYADDRVVLAPSAYGLQKVVHKMNDSVKKRGMKVDVGKTKAIVNERSESTTECDILIEGQKAEQAKERKSLYTWVVCLQMMVNITEMSKVE